MDAAAEFFACELLDICKLCTTSMELCVDTYAIFRVCRYTLVISFTYFSKFLPDKNRFSSFSKINLFVNNFFGEFYHSPSCFVRQCANLRQVLLVLGVMQLHNVTKSCDWFGVNCHGCRLCARQSVSQRRMVSRGWLRKPRRHVIRSLL